MSVCRVNLIAGLRRVKAKRWNAITSTLLRRRFGSWIFVPESAYLIWDVGRVGQRGCWRDSLLRDLRGSGKLLALMFRPRWSVRHALARRTLTIFCMRGD